MRGRISERTDDLEHLDDRAWPAVRDDQRHGVRVRRLHVDEVDVESVDLSLELWQRVQLRLALAPIMLGRPIARQLLQHRLLDALRSVSDKLLVGPARPGDAP